MTPEEWEKYGTPDDSDRCRKCGSSYTTAIGDYCNAHATGVERWECTDCGATWKNRIKDYD